eukprot:CAMPEP_0195135724 /NCGR_PEP_ID=MMETSP0448-20130528/152949_1 /TAXON_ID=66468 /ORGANISM="Heterocapsa triquestra, Strain CCMP 448" /LENGTH=64 /DNA_ID=CAMNT_0040173875 /DNA_START=1 /DNA_END=192 /DNA_ORIENTATION=+
MSEPSETMQGARATHRFHVAKHRSLAPHVLLPQLHGSAFTPEPSETAHSDGVAHRSDEAKHRLL